MPKKPKYPMFVGNPILKTKQLQPKHIAMELMIHFKTAKAVPCK